jgi:glutaminyl-tRNA synthetase
LIIENYPAGQTETLQAINHPDDPLAGTRPITFGREIYIEQDDFMEDPPKKFFRLAPGREVRLRYGFFVTCNEIERGPAGDITALRCTYDPATKGGNAPDGRKVQATLHWVAAADAVTAEVRLYEQLFNRPDPGADGDVMADLNPSSTEVLTNCLLEPALAAAPEGEAVQFERLGYFCRDRDTTPTRPVFNRTVGLRDTWAKVRAEASKPGRRAEARPRQ